VKCQAPISEFVTSKAAGDEIRYALRSYKTRIYPARLYGQTIRTKTIGYMTNLISRRHWL